MRTPAPDVVVVSQVPPPLHGQTLMTKRTLDLLADDGWAIRLVDRRFSRSIDEVGAASARKAVAALGLVGRLVATTVRRRPDAVVLYATTRTGSFAVDVVLARVLRSLRVPVVLSVHSVGFRSIAARGRLGQRAVRALLGSARAVVCLGPTLTSDVLPFVRPDRVHVIANTPPSLPASTGVDRADGTPTVLWLSNLMPGKGAECFARIAAELAPRTTAAFRLVGPVADPATAEAVDAIVATAGIADRCRRTGPRTGDAKWRALDDATVLAFTSELEEAQPLTIVEAMARGLPVVAFDRGGIRDLVDDGVTGFLVPPDDLAGFAAAVRRVLDDPDLAARLGHGARAAFRASHAPDGHVRAWNRLLTDLPSDRRKTP